MRTRLLMLASVAVASCALYIPSVVPPPAALPVAVRVRIVLRDLSSWDGESEYAAFSSVLGAELTKVGFEVVGARERCDFVLAPKGSLFNGWITGGEKPHNSAPVTVGVETSKGRVLEELSVPMDYYGIVGALTASALSRSRAVEKLAAAPAPAPPPLGAPPKVGDPKPVLVVFDIEDGGAQLTPGVLGQLTEYLTVQVSQTLSFQVVPRDQVRARLAEEKADSYKACYDQSCQIELGKALAAQKSLSTKILRIGGVCALTGTLYDLKRETIDRASSIKSPCEEAALLTGVDQLIAQLK